MPLFKFSTPVNAGYILLQVSVDGDALAPSYGDIVLDGMVSVFGQQTAVKGEGELVVSALLSGQAFAPADGDISLSVVVSGYSAVAADKTGSANLLFYPHSFITLDGEAILNGIATGSIIIRGVEIAGREAAHGSVVLQKPVVTGFGSRRAMLGNVLVKVVLDGSGVSTYAPERTGSGALLIAAPALSGFATIITSVVREGTGSLVCKSVNVFGIGLTSIHESPDAVIRYESNRRLL
jgi:hypothetical protein